MTTALLHLLPVGVGLIVTLLTGLGVRRAVRKVDIPIPHPSGADEKTIAAYHDALDFGDRHAAAFLGLLERVFFFSTLWIDQPVGVGAWFAVKVAAKWNAWGHIAKIPDNFGGNDLFEGVRFRHQWGGRIVSRFLIGTLYNVLCGVAGAAAGWLVVRLRDGGLAL